VPSAINSLPVPVALVVVAIEPTGTEVVVTFAVIALVKKYRPAVAFAIVAPVVAVEVNVPLTVEAVIAAPVTVVPEVSSGSLKATPTGFVFAMMFL
jgi:hypothetical protein